MEGFALIRLVTELVFFVVFVFAFVILSASEVSNSCRQLVSMVVDVY